MSEALSYPEPGTQYEGPADETELARFSATQDPKSYAPSRFARHLVEAAKQDAQRLKQRAWNAEIAPPRQPLSARRMVTALAGIYGYAPTFNGLRLPGLKLKISRPYVPGPADTVAVLR